MIFSKGKISTDLSETKAVNDLNIKINYLPKGQYFEGATKKQWLFLHHTAGWHNPFNTISQWGRDTRGEIATEFVLGGQSVKGNDNLHDGVIAQAFPTGGWGWHLGTGRGTMHSNSVGIEVCNFGQLKDGKTYVNVEAAKDQIIELKAPFKGHKFWHNYSDKQLQVLKELILYIANRDGIDVRKGLPEMIRQKGISAFDFCDANYVSKNPGLWNHTNVLNGKVDMYPHPKLIDLLLSL
jgi:hypothetical protein